MQFLGKFGKIVCWRPLLGEILDPPQTILFIETETMHETIKLIRQLSRRVLRQLLVMIKKYYHTVSSTLFPFSPGMS